MLKLVPIVEIFVYLFVSCCDRKEGQIDEVTASMNATALAELLRSRAADALM